MKYLDIQWNLGCPHDLVVRCYLVWKGVVDCQPLKPGSILNFSAQIRDQTQVNSKSSLWLEGDQLTHNLLFFFGFVAKPTIVQREQVGWARAGQGTIQPQGAGLRVFATLHLCRGLGSLLDSKASLEFPAKDGILHIIKPCCFFVVKISPQCTRAQRQMKQKHA